MVSLTFLTFVLELRIEKLQLDLNSCRNLFYFCADRFFDDWHNLFGIMLTFKTFKLKDIPFSLLNAENEVCTRHTWVVDEAPSPVGPKVHLLSSYIGLKCRHLFKSTSTCHLYVCFEMVTRTYLTLASLYSIPWMNVQWGHFVRQNVLVKWWLKSNWSRYHAAVCSLSIVQLARVKSRFHTLPKWLS